MRPQPHGFDRGVGRGEGGDHDAENILIDPLGRAQHVHAAHVGHFDVGDQQIVAPALERIDGRAAVFGQRDVVSFAPQHNRQQLSHRPLIVHDEQPRGQPGRLLRFFRSEFCLLFHRYSKSG